MQQAIDQRKVLPIGVKMWSPTGRRMRVSGVAPQSALHLGVLGIRGGTLRSASVQVWVVQ